MTTTVGLKRTPFYDLHVSLGAKMVPFAGFEMPVQYPTGITREHEIVRTGIGVFDVSHMGEFEITGPDRNAFVNRVTCNDVGALREGQAQYSAILTEDGTFVDDCLVYRFDDRLMMVVNASNIEKDWSHVVNRKAGINVRLKNISDEVALLAVQGPEAQALMQSLTKLNLATLGYYHFDTGQVAGIECFVSRTGYTGEDGFEIYLRDHTKGDALWDRVLEAGKPFNIRPTGPVEARRIEAGILNYPSDINLDTNPYEVGLGWLVDEAKKAD
ncbi:MAG: glycine cleavage system aminomethyltransferase GcvT, partial [Gemmatimonadetes bacterium]|nr:glycine cleavage system aminomethyltransferase GcvT [Gemmatimonadota bacterium]